MDIYNIINHSYYEHGTTAVLPDFFDPNILDMFMEAANETMIETLKHNISVELWLGETSSCYGGGAPVLSGSYIAGFMQAVICRDIGGQFRLWLDSFYYEGG